MPAKDIEEYTEALTAKFCALSQKLDIIDVLCHQVMNCRAIVDFITLSEIQLTEVRKGKIEVSRDRKRMWVTVGVIDCMLIILATKQGLPC